MTGMAGLLLLCAMTARAAGEPMVVEHYTVGEEAVLYVRGIEGEAEVGSYQIGTVPCEIEGLLSVRDAEEGIKTLILWDNSLSVMKKCGDRVKSILVDVIANRVPGEQFAVATIDEGLTYLSDYTDDYAALKQVVEDVSGENKDVYIIENLYQAIEDLNEMDDVGYKRIIVISDGMDAMEIGYSKSELDTLISQTPYPIYTIGILDKDHQEELQDMFALSRATGVDYFYLNEIEDDMEVVRALGTDYSVLQVKAAIPPQIQDGSMQNSQLVLKVGGSDVTLQSQVAMPFATQQEPVEEPEKEIAPEEQDMENPDALEAVSTEEPVAVAGKDGMGMAVWLTAAVVTVIVIVATLIIVLIKKGKKRKASAGNDYTKLDSRIKNERHGKEANVAGTSTVMEGVMDAGVSGGQPAMPVGGSPIRQVSERHKTQMLFDDSASSAGVSTQGVGIHRLKLANVKDAVQTYQCSIVEKVVIGRNPSVSNLVIADDAVSERHCEIEWFNGRFYVTDLGSSNGTYVDGVKIGVRTEVRSGTVLKLGRYEYRLTVE